MTVIFLKKYTPSPEDLKKSITILNNLDGVLKKNCTVFMPTKLINLNFDLLKEVLYNDSKIL